MENDRNGKRPKGKRTEREDKTKKKTTKIEDDRNGRGPKWKKTEIEDDQN